MKASGKNSEKYKFIHQGNGNYKIQNVNSGLFLTSEKQSSSNGTKIIQSGSASLWQVLPDGKGAYYLVPAFAAGSAIDLSGGKVENGRKIQLYTNNGTPSQRWLLK
jgi:glucosylceramidase